MKICFKMTDAWITPFQKQCFVVIGASINMSQLGMVMGFAAVLLPQLRASDSYIPIDDSSGSWIAALPGCALLVGNLFISTIMAKLGRKKACLISITIVILGWVCIVAAQNIIWILTARLLQGLSAGMSMCLTPIIIAESTSPKNRGAFSILMSLIMAAGTFIVHAVGSYFTWKLTALVITVISLVDLVIVILSPETPSWLADQGRYNECDKVFQWLRGDNEMNELQQLKEASIALRKTEQVNTTVSSKIKEHIAMVKHKEFYKPIIIMIHLHAIGQWGGVNILAPYIVDMVHYTVSSNDANIPLIIISADVQRIISSILAVFIIRKFKRRTMLFTSCGMNTLVFLITAGYIFAKNKHFFSFDHPLIGVILIHVLMITVAIGSLPLPFTIAGEIFTLRYRSLSSGISSISCSINLFLVVKSFPFLLKSIGLDGAYCLISGIMVYCLVVVWFLLPETKDRTLQDIEKEFKGKLVHDNKNSDLP